jgi:hypothetical protein
MAAVPDFVLLPVFDEHERVRFQGVALAIDDGHTATGQHEKPLIGTAMPIFWAAFCITWFDDHLRGLHPSISEDDIETFTET